MQARNNYKEAVMQTVTNFLNTKENTMIKIDGKVFATMELAMPFFNVAVKIEIYSEPSADNNPY
jgi:hypothetical protein